MNLQILYSTQPSDRSSFSYRLVPALNVISDYYKIPDDIAGKLFLIEGWDFDDQ
jgi:hypothetical protein